VSIGHGGQAQAAVEPGRVQRAMDPIVDQIARRRARQQFRFRLTVFLTWFVLVGLLVGGLWAAGKIDIDFLREWQAFILGGISLTLVISASSIFFACILAVLGALGRLSSNAVIYGVASFYVSLVRGTPLIVQILFIYLALPQIWPGFAGIPTIVLGIVALAFNYGAYMTEIFRAGIQSVGHGQSEAAEALGMNYVQKMRRVVLPQALRVIIPPTGNEFIAMMKDTALVSFLGASLDQMEIFRRAQLVGRADFRNLEALLIAAVMYWGLTTVFQYFQLRLERRLSKGYVRGTAGVAVAGQRSNAGA